MIKITKGKEPTEWTKNKNTPGIDYENADKTALRQALLEEQGGLCGYCMRRIKYIDKVVTDTRIEHLKPRALSLKQNRPEETLSYTNMILCCNGDIDNDGNAHCDRRKGEQEISFTPFDDAFIKTISYSSMDGRIKSSNKQYDEEFNTILNLNHPRLAANRHKTLEGLVSALGKGKWKKTAIEQKLEIFRSKTNGEYREYCGVVIWYLTKKLKQL